MTTMHLSVPRAAGGPVWVLSRLETRRQLRRPVLWIGAGLTVLILTGTTSDWSGGSYGDKIFAFMPLALSSLLAGYLTGRRDQDDQLAPEAPLGATERTLARLFSIVVPVTLAALIAVGIAVVSRVEGGFWIGEEPRRTDTALHPVLELVQPVLLVGLAGVFGVAVARLRRGPSLGLFAFGALVVFLSFPGYWIWNIPPGHTVALVQLQPLTVDLDPGVDADQLPQGWLVDAPGEYTDVWQRRLVHQPTIAGHDLYLVGLTLVVVGLAIGHRRRRDLVLVGVAMVVAGVAIQLAVMPDDLVKLTG